MKYFAHIGFPKCASTWLQKHVFPQHEEIFFLGRQIPDTIIDDEVREFLWSQLIDCHELNYRKEYYHAFAQRYADAAKRKGCKTICLSFELITNALVGSVDILERARRLFNFMPESKILMIIREQVSWHSSAYNMLIKELGGTFSIDEYSEWVLREPDRSPLTSLYYDRLFDVYAELFGKENILVIPYELLVEDYVKFVNKILDFMEIDIMIPLIEQKANQSAGTDAIHQLLNMNKAEPFIFGTETLLTRPLGKQAIPIYTKNGGNLPEKYEQQHERHRKNFMFAKKSPQSGRVTINVEDARIMQDIYAIHNERLQQLTDIDLSTYFYSGT